MTKRNDYPAEMALYVLIALDINQYISCRDDYATVRRVAAGLNCNWELRRYTMKLTNMGYTPAAGCRGGVAWPPNEILSYNTANLELRFAKAIQENAELAKRNQICGTRLEEVLNERNEKARRLSTLRGEYEALHGTCKSHASRIESLKNELVNLWGIPAPIGSVYRRLWAAEEQVQELLKRPQNVTREFNCYQDVCRLERKLKEQEELIERYKNGVKNTTAMYESLLEGHREASATLDARVGQLAALEKRHAKCEELIDLRDNRIIHLNSDREDLQRRLRASNLELARLEPLHADLQMRFESLTNAHKNQAATIIRYQGGHLGVAEAAARVAREECKRMEQERDNARAERDAAQATLDQVAPRDPGTRTLYTQSYVDAEARRLTAAQRQRDEARAERDTLTACLVQKNQQIENQAKLMRELRTSAGTASTATNIGRPPVYEELQRMRAERNEALSENKKLKEDVAGLSAIKRLLDRFTGAICDGRH